MRLFLVYVVLLIGLFRVSDGAICSITNNNLRLDCYPQLGANQAGCLARGCCWSTPKTKRDGSADVPYCFYPLDFPTYQIQSNKQTPNGRRVTLTKLGKSYLLKEILTLLLEVIHETNSRVRVRITDPKSKRFEVPIQLSPADSVVPHNLEYDVLIPVNGSFSLEIKRKCDGVSMFKTYGPLLYADQFIQIASLVSTNQIYGIGEQNRPFLHNLTQGWHRLGLWARDNAIATNINLYGTHPFYMTMPATGHAFGTFFFNSNAQEFGLQPAPAITYRTIGGILDMFFFTGGTPEKTVGQYLDLIGKPMLTPFWSLGFHLCRYGYKNLSEIATVFQRNIDAGIPIGTQWADIDYMDKYKDFTIDAKNFNGLNSFVTTIRKRYGARFVVIIDPAIYNKGGTSYQPYVDGLKMNVYVKDVTTKLPLRGQVWPGETVFPDFTHPNATAYWTKAIREFHSTTHVDGLWIDMNEPSSFVDGSINGCPANNTMDHPFFTPIIRDNSLITKTICPSSLHYNDIPHYNLHNLYGYTEAVATNNALRTILPHERPFILSRSTFSGSGKYTNHWTGDNFAQWDQMANSIRQIMNFNMFGIPMTGADVCGFINDSTEELCIRWMQLGSFYPFMRNHNSDNAKDQDPAFWSANARNIMKKYINIRYALLPYLNTLLVKAHLNGSTVFKPLSFEFYSDPTTHGIDRQFMLGSALLVTPVLTEGATSVTGYLPDGVWYDFMNSNLLKAATVAGSITFDAPLDTINVSLRGGHIVPLLDSAMTIDRLRQNNLTLYGAMSKNKTATGELYWEDGISGDSFSANKFTHLLFSANVNGLTVAPRQVYYKTLPSLMRIIITGLTQPTITEVTVNGQHAYFTYNSMHGLLLVDNLHVSLLSPVIANWH